MEPGQLPGRRTTRQSRLAALALAALLSARASALEPPGPGEPVATGTASAEGSPSDRHSWLVPTVESLTLDLAIWGVARVTNGTRSPDWSIRFPDVFTRYPFRAWQFDLDDFDMNQLMHPCHFQLYFTAARSSGLDFWESSLFPLLGSLVWELFMETQAPSVNDQITSTFGGIFLGEGLYRLSDMVLLGGGESPGVLRQIGSFLIAPMAGFNRLVFGYPTDIARPISSMVQFSAGGNVGGTAVDGAAVQGTGFRAFAGIDVTQFGVRGWRARRPFEHFDFSAGFGAGGRAAAADGPTNAQWHLFVSGLLWPMRVDGGNRFQGLWGVFGGYDYDEPSVLRVSTSTLGVGITGQWELGGRTALQGTAVGSWVVLGNSDAMASAVTLRSYKAGPSLEALLDAKVLLGDAAWLRAVARQYVLVNPVHSAGWEEITHASASLLVRIWGPHALSVEAELARRQGHYPDLADDRQRAGFLRVAYSFLSDPGLGYVSPAPAP